MTSQSEVQHIVETLKLQPHPEGGYYREVWRAPLTIAHAGLPAAAERAACTAIYFLLPAGEFSAWHRVKASDEVWHLYRGGPLELHVIDNAGDLATQMLTNDLAQGQPQCIVPAGHWQAARPAPNTPYALCGCTVAPGFDFADFEMPGRAALLAEFPQHEKLVRELTRA